MSLLIKALKKAEKSKEAKDEANSSGSGLTLELAPIEEKPRENISPPIAEAVESETNAKAEDKPLADTPKPEQAKAAEPASSSAMVHDDIAAALMEESGFSLNEEAGFAGPTPSKTAKTAPSAKIEKPSKAVKPTTPEPTVPAAAETSSASSGEQRQAAMNLLGARAELKRPPGNRRSLFLGMAGLLLLLILGGGFYYYLQTLDQPQLAVMQPAAISPAPMPAPSPAATPQPTPAPVVAEVKPSPPAAPVSAAMPAATPSQSAAQEQASMMPESSMQQTTAFQPMRMAKSAPTKKSMSAHHTATGQDSAVNVARLRMAEPTTDATQVAAYQAYQAGDDTAANKLYRQVLQNDPRNVDALLGLAAVSARQNRNEEAVSIYQRVLELDPGNSFAQEGLISLLGQANPTESASRLKTLISQQPDAAHLHAALGNVYADQNQWPDAQQAYFKAFELDPNNADYAFNLAVSLDQLKKPDLALNYYQQALALLGKQGGSVDRTALENRISELKAATGK
jgi:tetratricopeptide (TPR) repeat protein